MFIIPDWHSIQDPLTHILLSGCGPSIVNRFQFLAWCDTRLSLSLSLSLSPHLTLLWIVRMMIVRAFHIVMINSCFHYVCLLVPVSLSLFLHRHWDETKKKHFSGPEKKSKSKLFHLL